MEVQELVPLKNQFEIQEGIEMSRDGIVNFVDSMMAKEFSNGSDWQIRLSMEECSMSTRNGGSKFNQ